MRLTTLGGLGAFPAAGQACSGYLVEHEGFTVLIDPGYATLPVLLESMAAEDVDAVLVSHGHPDHCADLNPLLRARVMSDAPPAALPVYALPGALDAVLALDRPAMMAPAYALHEIVPRKPYELGPFRVDTWLLRHHVPNVGLRLSGGGKVIAYTGDTGPTPDLVELAKDADIYLAEATHPEEVPGDNAPYLSSARQAGADAARAGVGQLLLTHLWPGSSEEAALTAAGREFGGPIAIALRQTEARRSA